ncbi:hypothetical protein DENSPDRAFT_834151 [Dentipellis sp. KUC8613]|nr:hypothetical protein DENSPDRAFT_834151 [Dentipellis sp. KUC8613]
MASFHDSASPAALSPKQRRRSAALSCAECRRLKLRCSRVFPCTSCVKKGCAAICPDGSLTTGKGNRFILANTEVLHDKIGQLSTRVRQLEDALAESHSYHASERHPLLSDDLLQIKRPLEREAKNEMPPPPEIEAAEAIDAVGSLSISEKGRTNFFGQTANSWYLLKNEAGSSDEDEVASPEVPLPTDIPWLAHAFPFNTTRSSDSIRGSLLGLLPNASKARQLADIYFQHAAWMYTPIDQREFHDSIFLRIYDPHVVTPEHDPIASHRLAVLYMILALGALLDLEKPANSYDATQYFQLGRAALALDSVFEEQSITAIQALVIMSHYMFLSDIDGPRWALMGLVVKLAHSCGLHRDSGKWNLSNEETHRRRSLMWEIYTYDSWQSLTYGRPPSFSLLHMDCQMAHEPYKNEQGEEEMSFALWKHRFSSQCLSIVHDQAFGARTPSYKVIQELDKKVRNFYTPPSLQVPGFGGPMGELAPPPAPLTLQRYVGFAIREITIFYMHRGFFARAIEDNSDDPLGSKYAPSVLAAYNSACSFVGLIKSLFSQQPTLTERMWFLFTHVFSCAIVLSSIPIKCPSMALARSALSHLDSALRLFEQVAENPRAVKVVPILRKQRERAISSMSDMNGQTPLMSPSRVSPPEIRDVKREDDELATLGGKTRLVPRKASSTPSSPAKAASLPASSPGNSPASAHIPTPPPYQPPSVPTNLTSSSAHRVGAGQENLWQPYGQPQQTFVHDYTAYTMAPEQWQDSQTVDFGYSGLQQASSTMSMDVMADQFSAPSFDYAASLRATSYLAGPQQAAAPNSGEVNTASDPNAAWQSLVAQFNHV